MIAYWLMFLFPIENHNYLLLSLVYLEMDCHYYYYYYYLSSNNEIL